MPNGFVGKKALIYIEQARRRGQPQNTCKRTGKDRNDDRGKNHWGELRRMMAKRQTRDYLIFLR